MKPLRKSIADILQLFAGKKRIVSVVIAAAVWTAASVALVLHHIVWPVVVSDVLLICAFGTVLSARYAYEKWLAEEKPESSFHNLNNRNMDAIAVGSTKAWKYLDTRNLKGRLFCCTTYRRSLTMDFATLKTFFSHTRPGANAFLFIDRSEINRIGERIFARDWKYSHPHVFLEMGVKSNDITRKNPLTHDTGYLFGYFFRSLPKRLGLYRLVTWRCSKRESSETDEKQVEALSERLDAIIDFCTERDLHPVILLLSGTAEDNRVNRLLADRFSGRADEATVQIIRNAKEMNAFIRETILKTCEHGEGRHGKQD